MRILLRHIRTGHYYMGNLEWTLEAKDATDFSTIDHAIDLVVHDELDGMSLIVRYPDSEYEQEFPLTEGTPAEKPVIHPLKD